MIYIPLYEAADSYALQLEEREQTTLLKRLFIIKGKCNVFSIDNRNISSKKKRLTILK